MRYAMVENVLIFVIHSFLATTVGLAGSEFRVSEPLALETLHEPVPPALHEGVEASLA